MFSRLILCGLNLFCNAIIPLIKLMFIFGGLVVVTGNHQNGGVITLFPDNVDNNIMEIILFLLVSIEIKVCVHTLERYIVGK